MATVERLASLTEAAKLSARVAAEDRESRDREIEKADQQGMGTREISRATGLVPSHICHIIANQTAARQADM